MTPLPHIGRPSRTGLSVKLLGMNEYQRRYQRSHKPRRTSRRWWTGLAEKLMSRAEYMAKYRALRK